MLASQKSKGCGRSPPSGASNIQRKIKLANKRNTSRYTLWDGRKKVYIGITNDPEGRENAHQKDKNFDQMRVEGPKVSRDTALEWEQDALETYGRGHDGKSPKYNG